MKEAGEVLPVPFMWGGGAILGILLLWRVWHRIRRGMTSAPKQALVLNFLSGFVMWGFLAAIMIVVVTGYFLPWSVGRPLDIFGIMSIPSPMERARSVHEFLEEVHEIAGQVFVPLLALHLIGVAKHIFIDKDDIAKRMANPVSNGK